MKNKLLKLSRIAVKIEFEHLNVIKASLIEFYKIKNDFSDGLKQ